MHQKKNDKQITRLKNIRRDKRNANSSKRIERRLAKIRNGEELEPHEMITFGYRWEDCSITDNGGEFGDSEWDEDDEFVYVNLSINKFESDST